MDLLPPNELYALAAALNATLAPGQAVLLVRGVDGRIHVEPAGAPRLANMASPVAAPSIQLSSVLTTDEFAYLVRETPESIRRHIRQKKIKATGNPAKIPCRELLKFGVDLADAARLLHARSQQQLSA